MKLLLDLDGVVANFCYGIQKFLNEKYNCTFDLNSDPETYNFDGWGNGLEKLDLNKVTLDWIKQDGFFDLPLCRGAEELLSLLQKTKPEVHIVTARLGWDFKPDNITTMEIKSDTVAWLRKQNINYEHLTFQSDKIEYCLKNNINLIIEDNLATAQRAAEYNINDIAYFPTLLIDRKYNQAPECPFVHRIYNYSEIGKYL